MDWGIVVTADSELARAEHSFGGLALRKDRLLGSSHTYFLVMVGNLVLRFAWTLTLLQPDVSSPRSFAAAFMAHLTPFVAAAEVMRRMVWGFLRLEWEHMEKMHLIGVSAKPNKVYSRVEYSPGGRVRDTDDGINPEEMEKMSIGNSSEYPDFTATWDPDGRLHSVIPFLARFFRCCVAMEIPGFFESCPVLMPTWWTQYACFSFGNKLYADIAFNTGGGGRERRRGISRP